jgi:hypothetical protein
MCTVDQGNKVTKKTNKKQGKPAKENSAGYKNKAGIGEAFVEAVGKVTEEAKSSKGSQQGFLGQDRISIDVKKYSHTLENENQTEVKPEHCPAAPLWDGKGPNSSKGKVGKEYIEKE